MPTRIKQHTHTRSFISLQWNIQINNLRSIFLNQKDWIRTPKPSTKDKKKNTLNWEAHIGVHTTYDSPHTEREKSLGQTGILPGSINIHSTIPLHTG
jgi:hypothetical protein